MSGKSDLRRDSKYWCPTHRRYMPYGRIDCLLCELERLEQAEAALAKSG